MLNGETKHVDWGSQALWPPLGTGPVASAKARPKISIINGRYVLVIQ